MAGQIKTWGSSGCEMYSILKLQLSTQPEQQDSFSLMATIRTVQLIQLSSSLWQNPRTLRSYAFLLIPHMHYSHVMLVFSPPLHLTGLLKWRRYLILGRGSADKPS